MPATSIRQLIARALDEARDEFAAIVQRKLEELMGDADTSQVSPAARGGTARSGKPTKATPKGRPDARQAGARTRGEAPSEDRARRRRTPEAEMAELRAKILAAMPVGEPLKRGHILSRAGLGDDDQLRVSNLLRKLKDEGLVVMKGERAAATYTRTG